MKSWIQTYTGRQFDPTMPQPGDIYIEDIAESLAKMCRFNGHCIGFYSVAQHSVLVCDYLRRQEQPLDVLRWGLAHDFGEAYVCDVPRPIKHGIPAFRQMEDAILEQVAFKWGLPWPMPREVKHADNVLLATEKRDLMRREPAAWGPLPDPMPSIIVPWEWQHAKERFLRAYDELFT